MLLGATTTSPEIIQLPNATTWAIMGLVLVITIFFRFTKPLRIRNWDILLLFILAMPLLYLRDRQEQREKTFKVWQHPEQITLLAAEYFQQAASAPFRPAEPAWSTAIGLDQISRQDPKLISNLAFQQHEIWRAYFWLLMGSALLMARSLVDLGLERKGEFRPNLNTGGMIWFTCVLLIIMAAKPWLSGVGWDSVPRQQHESIVLTYLQGVLHDSQIFPYFPWGLALLSHSLIVMMLILIGITIFRNALVGAAAAMLYLLLPYTALLLNEPAQVVASMFVILAVLLYRWPMWAGFSLGLGTCLGFFPAILIPAWFGFYFRRGHWRFLFTFLTVVLGLVLFLALTQGLGGAWDKAWSLAEWQAWKFALKPTADGLWNTVSLHGAYRIPLFIMFLALMVTSALWPHPKNLGQLISWSAVLILGVQFWYADAGGIYILWYLPLVILQTLRPSLAAHRPAMIEPERDRLRLIFRWFVPKRDPGPEHRQLPPPTALAG